MAYRDYCPDLPRCQQNAPRRGKIGWTLSARPAVPVPAEGLHKKTAPFTSAALRAVEEPYPLTGRTGRASMYPRQPWGSIWNLGAYPSAQRKPYSSGS